MAACSVWLRSNKSAGLNMAAGWAKRRRRKSESEMGVGQFDGARLLTSRLLPQGVIRRAEGRLARIAVEQDKLLAPPAACHSRRRGYFCGWLAPIAQMDRAAVS